MLQICFTSDNSIIIVLVNSLLLFRYFGWLRLCTDFSLITINYRFMNGRNLQVQIIQSNIHPGEYSQSRLIRKPMTKHKTYAFSWDVPMIAYAVVAIAVLRDHVIDPLRQRENKYHFTYDLSKRIFFCMKIIIYSFKLH